jgi:hypothetical protein
VGLGLSLAASAASRWRSMFVHRIHNFVFLSLLLKGKTQQRYQKDNKNKHKQFNHGFNFLPRMGAHGKER